MHEHEQIKGPKGKIPGEIPSGVERGKGHDHLTCGGKGTESQEQRKGSAEGLILRRKRDKRRE